MKSSVVFAINEICEHLGIKRDTAFKWILYNNMPSQKMVKLCKFK